MTRDINEICRVMCLTAKSAGRIMHGTNPADVGITQKPGTANYVTECDVAVQKFIARELSVFSPEIGFFGEEDTEKEKLISDLAFVVDPIDGTTNFIRDYHASSISVALVVDGTAELGAVYNPYLDEMFSAKRGCGAFCNGNRLHVSSEPLENALVIFGTSPYREELGEQSFKLAYSYFRQAADVRRSGSAALDLCAVAAGRADLFFELSLSPWDYAAGALIVEEAGGIVSDADGGNLLYDRPCSVVARNKTVPILSV